MSIYNLKPRFQALLRPLMRLLASWGITANQVTLLALILSLAFGVCIALFSPQRWPLLLLPVFMFVRMAFNAIDGMLAREHHMQSSLGMMLNELGDVVADSALYLAFACVEGFRPALVVLTVLLSILSEFAGVVSVQIGATRRYDGPLGKSDRAFLFGLLGLLIGLRIDLTAWLDAILAVACLLLVITILNRCYQALGEVAGKKEKS